MITIKREIEIDKDNYIEVEFIGNPSRQNDSYSDEYGVVQLPNYWIVDDINWDAETAYTKEENRVIDKYLDLNYSDIEDEMIKKYTEEFED